MAEVQVKKGIRLLVVSMLWRIGIHIIIAPHIETKVKGIIYVLKKEKPEDCYICLKFFNQLKKLEVLDKNI